MMRIPINNMVTTTDILFLIFGIVIVLICIRRHSQYKLLFLLILFLILFTYTFGMYCHNRILFHPSIYY